jgi:hypothetical protein
MTGVNPTPKGASKLSASRVLLLGAALLVVVFTVAIWVIHLMLRGDATVVVLNPNSSSNVGNPITPTLPGQTAPHGLYNFTGVWAGKFEDKWPVQLTIRNPKGDRLAILFQVSPPDGGPTITKRLAPTPTGPIAFMARAPATMVISQKNPNTASIVWSYGSSGFPQRQLKAILIRGATANFAAPNQALGATMPIMVDITADVDGSDVLKLMNWRATWTHKYFQIAQNVTIDGRPWDLKSQPTLNVPELLGADMSSVKVLSRSGRDTLAVEGTANGITIYFADNPAGADTYRVRLGFNRQSTAAPPVVRTATNPAKLDVVAAIEGSDVLTINQAGARWRQVDGGPPSDVTVNGKPMDPSANLGLSELGLAGVDLSSAAVLSRSGRDIVAMEKTGQGLDIYFADTPGGSDRYEIQISFGR